MIMMTMMITDGVGAVDAEGTSAQRTKPDCCSTQQKYYDLRWNMHCASAAHVLRQRTNERTDEANFLRFECNVALATANWKNQ